ncbi:flagellar type III secretion system pore protein FliP [Legionella quateirensis]|uniref:Flagellar biosynthetic protein FliP n=1 Tax=Legionella quateirensis TaxID=45072 RepID=A0A378KV77_9GAMM|nr:flagellar type III secretion system pore protein FliP [Legionella quateirensis]KTD51326.1 flagellar biosynthesis protein FliP [Legionella quateirensis]STY17427.1 flagellar biosynthetic protein FliP [Legionella quateirensis]
MNNHYQSSIEGLSPDSTSHVNAYTVSHSPLSATPSVHSGQKPIHRFPRNMSHLLYFLLFFFPISNALAGTQIGPIHFDQDNVSPALQAFALLTILSLAPSILIMLSSFTRIVVVLSMLRNALGLQQTPPNTVLISLSLFLTLFTMMPVAKAIYTEAYQPYENREINTSTALNRAAIPLKQFMIKQTREKDMHVILQLAKEPLPASADEIKLYQLIPAFILSELQTAFQIGFMIFLPFLLVDLIVSGILMTMGMMMMPPLSISLPVKILLFILIDGWDLIVQALVGSFN